MSSWSAGLGRNVGSFVMRGIDRVLTGWTESGGLLDELARGDIAGVGIGAGAGTGVAVGGGVETGVAVRGTVGGGVETGVGVRGTVGGGVDAGVDVRGETAELRTNAGSSSTSWSCAVRGIEGVIVR